MDRDRDRERWFWIVTGVLVVAVVAALRAFGGSGQISNNTSRHQAEESAPNPTQAAIDAPRPLPHASLERPPDTRIATVFVCRVNGERIYSDQRCGSSAYERPIPAPNTMDAQDTSILSSPDTVLARSRSERTNAKEPVIGATQSECRSIEEQKNSIDARMREGYTSYEGEQFRDLLRQLGTRYYELRCRHFR